jgi:hypothetical protein
VTWGGRVILDATPMEEVHRAALDRDRAVVAERLRDAETRGVVSHDVVQRVLHDLDVERDRSVRTERPVVAAAAARSGAAPTAAPPTAAPPTAAPVPAPAATATKTAKATTPPRAVPARRPVRAPAPRRAPAPVEPGLVARWWARTRTAVASDLAVHGLAYLGVLLLFAGVFGLVAFSFGDVDPMVRGLAEVLAPTAFFGSAAYLVRRRAVVVAAALEFLGGAILPVVAIASVTDGAAVPPDAAGHALPALQGALCLLIAGAYVAVVRRRPTSTLRFAAAPAAWLGIGLLSGVLRDTVVTGRDMIRPAPFQMAVVAGAVAVTVAAIRLLARHGAVARGALAAAVPAAVIAVVAEAGLAASAGWPVASGVVVAVAALVLLDTFGGPLRPAHVTVAQTVVVFAGALRLLPALELAWSAAVAAAALVFLAEWSAYRRPTVIGAIATSAGLVVAVAGSLPEPLTMLVVTTALTGWTLVRYVRPATVRAWADTAGVVPGVSAALAGVALARVIDPAVAVAACGATVAAVAVGGRLVRRVRERTLWTWWVPSAAAVLVAATVAIPWPDQRWLVALASTLVAVALAVGPGNAAVRTWASAATTAWAGASAAAALGLDSHDVALVLAGAGLALVVTAALTSARVPHHLGAIGHLAAAAAPIVAGGRGTVAAVATTTFALGWIATAIATEVARPPRRPAVDRLVEWFDEASTDLRWIDQLPAVIAIAAIPVAAFVVSDAASFTAMDDPWAAVVTAVAVATTAVTVRLVRWSRARGWVLAGTVTATALGAVGLAEAGTRPDGAAALVTVLVTMSALALLPRPQLPTTPWLLWSGSAAATVLFVHVAGVSHRWSDVVLAAWGAVVLLGAMGRDRKLAGPVGDGVPVRTPTLWPPVVLGATATVSGVIAACVGETAAVVGAVLLGAGAVVLAVALLVRVGVAGALGWSLLVAGATFVRGDDTWRDDRWYTLCAAVLLVVAWLLQRLPGMSDRAVRDRWDVGAFLTAHLAAIAALDAGATAGDVAPAAAITAALALVIALVLRRGEWAVAAGVLALVAAVAEQRGWPALVLTVEGAAATGFAFVRRGILRRLLLVVGAAQLVAGWLAFVTWLDWSPTTVLVTTVSGSAAAVLVTAAVLHARVGPTDALVVWSITAIAAMLAADLLVLLPSVGRAVGWSVVALGFAALAASAALVATRVGAAARWVCALLAIASAGAELVALDPAPVAVTATATSVALVLALVVVFLRGARPASPWLAPLVLLVGVAQLGGMGAAVTDLPDRGGLIAVFLAAAAEAAAIGAAWRSTAAVAVSPALACTGWLVYADEALSGDPNWFTVPIGLTFLITSGGVRWVRDRRGDPATTLAGTDVATLEIAGAALMVAAATVQTMLGDLAYSLLVLAAGIGFVVWATIGRVRRRLAIGVVVILLAVALLLGVPLVRAVPTMSGPALWVTVAVIGLLVIVLATSLEQGRRRVERLGQAWREMTAGWE